jgi:hypothetical protein
MLAPRILASNDDFRSELRDAPKPHVRACILRALR